MTSAIDTLLARLTALHPRIIDLSLGRIERLLETLGHPERKLPPVVHVAGTNGKGSTIAFCRSILEEAGYLVHVYTSPHLVKFNERIVLAGREISDAQLLHLLERVEEANAGAEITFFEITTAAAFLAFAEPEVLRADILLLEVGLGGRLDATNVIDKPAVTCITPVDFDHQKYLGDTIEKIAAEKAGILKPGVPCVVTRQLPAAMAVIEDRARAIGAPLYVEDRDWRVIPGDGVFRYQSVQKYYKLSLPMFLPGAHQLHNAGAAIACLDNLSSFTFMPGDVILGVSGAEWSARLQHLTRGPLATMLPGDWQLWLDGAHNPHGARALAGWIAAQTLPVHLVTAMLDSKDPTGFFDELKGRVATIHTVPVPSGHSGIDPAALAETARRSGHDVAVAVDAAAAIRDVLAKTKPGPAILMIAGSLYLAGAILAENG